MNGCRVRFFFLRKRGASLYFPIGDDEDDDDEKKLENNRLPVPPLFCLHEVGLIGRFIALDDSLLLL